MHPEFQLHPPARWTLCLRHRSGAFARIQLWLNFSTGLIRARLHRTPVLRTALVSSESAFHSAASTRFAAGLVSAASLVAAHMLAGATQLVVSPAPPASGAVGQPFTMGFAVTGAPGIVESYRVSGDLPPGVTIPGLRDGVVDTHAGVISGTPAHAGTYPLLVRAYSSPGATGDATLSFPLIVTIAATGTPPQFAVQPRSWKVPSGLTVALSAKASGTITLNYQWLRDGQPVTGATNAALTLPNVQATDTGSYCVVVTNANGTATSSAAVLAVLPAEQEMRFTTFAGRPGPDFTGCVDGAAANARFAGPNAIAVDGAGDLYVSDSINRVIRKITRAGVVTTLAGACGMSGHADGAGTDARFASPAGIAVDPSGNVYVAEWSSHTIRKITAAGMVTTLAGFPGAPGAVDGVGRAARLCYPTGLAVDAMGNVYVADTYNRTIRKITFDGTVSTVAGRAGLQDHVDGSRTEARLHSPHSLAVDGDGSIVFTDGVTLRRIAADGRVTTIAGLPDAYGLSDGAGGGERFANPTGVACDRAGNIYVTDSGIRKITCEGVVTTVATHVDGELNDSAARFYFPTGIAVDAAGTVFVADTGHHAIRWSGGRGVSQLMNFSIRGRAGPGDDAMILGFALSGSGRKPLLFRGIGPALTAFGVTSSLADPALRLSSTRGALIAENDDWQNGSAGEAGAIASATAAVGAFALPEGGKDAALLPMLSPGGYTVQLAGGSGAALVEAYDVERDAALAFSNLSARAVAGSGDDSLIAGFAIAGEGLKTVLIRAVGPGLAAFGVANSLADPRVELFAGATKINENDNWGGGAVLAEQFARLGAFPLAEGSRDAALLVTLPPGSYTMRIGGASGATGPVLVELYNVP